MVSLDSLCQEDEGGIFVFSSKEHWCRSKIPLSLSRSFCKVSNSCLNSLFTSSNLSTSVCKVTVWSKRRLRHLAAASLLRSLLSSFLRSSSLTDPVSENQYWRKAINYRNSTGPKSWVSWVHPIFHNFHKH